MINISYIKHKFNNVFPALTHKNFRYFWTGQCVSLIGTWMQNTGQAWLVLTVTNSPLLLGLVNALQFTPMFMFSLFAGVFVDKFSKKKILIFTQSILMILAAVLALLVWTNYIKYWHILILATLLGFVNTIDMPTRQSFMIDLVGKEDLMNAISLNSAVFNGARIIGPAVSGLLIHYLGMSVCFFINSISFIPVIYGISKIQVKSCKSKRVIQGSIFAGIKDGLVYIKNDKRLFNTVLLVSVVGVFAMNYNVLIPLLAKVVLHKESKEYGLLMSFMGIGSFLGAFSQIIKSKSGPKKNLLYTSTLAISIVLVLIGFSKNYALDAILLFLAGFFNISFSTTANSTMQLNSSDEYRGRVMSVYALVFGGLSPIGSLFSGSVSNNISVNFTFILSGVIILCFVVSIFMFEKKSLKSF